MRLLQVSLVLLSLNCIALAQDPTQPSQEILQRLKGDGASAVSIAAQKPTKLFLKAIVLSDKNHGTALVDVEGRLVRVALDRTSTRVTNDESDNNSAPLRDSSRSGIEVGGAFFYVEDFDSNSITVFDGLRRVHVK